MELNELLQHLKQKGPISYRVMTYRRHLNTPWINHLPMRVGTICLYKKGSKELVAVIRLKKYENIATFLTPDGNVFLITEVVPEEFPKDFDGFILTEAVEESRRVSKEHALKKAMKSLEKIPPHERATLQKEYSLIKNIIVDENGNRASVMQHYTPTETNGIMLFRETLVADEDFNKYVSFAPHEKFVIIKQSQLEKKTAKSKLLVAKYGYI